MPASGRWWRLAGVAGAVIVAFDIAASLVSRHSGVPYSRFAYGSFLIQAGTGFVARRASQPFLEAMFLGTWVGVIEATIGWAASWWIGPGRPTGMSTPTTVAFAIVYVAVLATVFGALGAWLGQVGRARVRDEV